MNYVDYVDMLHEEQAASRMPVSATFELTARCNLRCRMCYVCKPVADEAALQEELSEQEWLTIAKQLQEMGVVTLVLTGGEAMLLPHFSSLYAKLHDMGFLITILTNGVLITEQIANLLATRKPLDVSITLYGSSNAVYEAVTGDKLGFEKVDRAIARLQTRNIPLSVKTTFIRHNAADLPGLVDYYRSRNLQFGYICDVDLRKEGTETNPASVRLSLKERIALEQAMVATGIVEADEFEPLQRDISKRAEVFQCKTGKTSLYVDWRGNLVPCGLLNEPKIPAKTQSVADAWKQLQVKMDDIPACIDCQACDLWEYCDVCPANCYLENATFLKAPKQLCAYVKERRILSNNVD